MKRLALLILFCCVASAAQADRTTGTIHVFVALCDNEHQGIVKVRPEFGDGDEPNHNLYWGAYYGVRNYFKRAPQWTLVSSVANPEKNVILEQIVFERRDSNVRLVAHAYRGREIKRAVGDFLDAAAGLSTRTARVTVEESGFLGISRDRELYQIPPPGPEDLVVYVGHNGLMDFNLDKFPEGRPGQSPAAAVLACLSFHFFNDALRKAEARPLLWTTGLMAPEAYVLEAAVEGWLTNESDETLQERAAQAYQKYQRCGIGPARRLFKVGF
jgi:hypothetical protein